ncbi:hypothetical protein ACLB2K_069208 [Fragaria x ananassa]
MEEKPLMKTLNMIDKLMYEVNSPSSGSSSGSTNKTAESSQQLCDAPTDITLHQSWLQLPSNTNKRKAKAPVTPENEDRIQKSAAPTNPEHQKLVVSVQENIESNSKSDDGENLHDPEQVARDLTLYKIKKKLTMSDLGNLSRLLVLGYMVKNFVLPLVDADFKQRVESKAGKQVTVKDSDKETEHQLTFRYLKSSKSYVFNGKWKEFVKRRDLKKDDEIGLYWDTHDSKFHFSVLKVASQERQAATEVARANQQ